MPRGGAGPVKNPHDRDGQPGRPEAPQEGMVKGPYSVPTYQTVVDDGNLYLTVELADLVGGG